ncbi:MAG: hypothetical protein KatS3mg101_1128 [Patescibacteria group bacterium]|nr:MAG: hypothetical protein KatS3mg101_1128 [Patescibacteria group bacterium]
MIMENNDNNIEYKIYKLLSSMNLNEKIKLKHGVWGFHGLFPIIYRLSYYKTRAIKKIKYSSF